MAELIMSPYSVEIPPEELAVLVNGYIVANHTDEAATLTYFDEGHHNTIYLCEYGQNGDRGQFAVRLPKCPEAIAALEADYTVRRALSGDKPVPGLLYFGRLACSKPVIFEEFIPGEHKKLDTLTADEIDALGEAIVDLHNITTDQFSDVSGAAPTRTGTYADYIRAMVKESVTDRLAENDMTAYGEAEGLLAAGQEALETTLAEQADLFSEGTFSLLSHDLSWRNIRWPSLECRRRVYLLDSNFTYGDPADDLSYIMVDNNTSPAFNEGLLAAYKSPKGSGKVWERVPAYHLKNRLDDLAWGIMMLERHGGAEYEEGYRQRLISLKTLLG
jgi:aminoglycoside phosphotransferase (APT) family kinase protein